MDNYIDKLHRFYIFIIHVINNIIIYCRSMAIPGLCILLFFSGSVLGQCPGNSFFNERINFIYKSEISNESKLKALMGLLQKMQVCHLEKDSSLVSLLQKIGVLHFKQANYASAINFTHKAIGTAKECIARKTCNTRPLLHNYYNLYYYYDKTAQLKEKYEVIDSFINYVLKTKSGYELAITPLIDITDYLFNKGEYNLCSNNARLGEYIIQKYYHGKDSIGHIVSFVNKQANALYYSKNIALAEEILENKKSQFEKTGNSRYNGSFYSLLGVINTDKKNYKKAISYFQKAYKANLLINFRGGCAQSLTLIGTLYAKFYKKYDTGLHFCSRALSFADAIDSLLILRQAGDIFVLKGMHLRARQFYQQAYNTIQYGMNETTLLKSSFKFPGFNQLQDISDLTVAKGDAYLQEYYHTKNDSFLVKALGVYKKADLFLAKIKTEQQLAFASNLIWRTTARNLYEHAIEACYAYNNIEDAFYFFEKSRAILLNDQINQQRWMADKDIAKQAAIKKTINYLERDIEIVPASTAEYLKIQNDLYISNQQLQLLHRSIQNKNPLFYQNYLDTIFLTTDQVRKKILNNSTTLLEVFSGDSAMYVLTIAPKSETLVKINKKLYDSLTRSFNSFITNHNRLNTHFKDFVKTGHQLFHLLFQNKYPSYGSIIISPDGVSYPFEALIVHEHDKQPDYFLNYYAISYTYSVKYLTNQFAPNTNSNSVLGMAPVHYKKNENLAGLGGSDKSLQKIKNYFSNATNYVLEKATKNNFLKNFPEYSIVQLYTHAADSSDNKDPVIYFSDSAFYLSDLFTDRKPHTQLVVLSACETAKGKVHEGEGIFSFNRGFAALGIPAAVSNLWSVDNESTYRITELFYKYLSEGFPTDVALQKAKLAFINTGTSKADQLPYFWAGPILTGKVDTIKIVAFFPWVELAGATVLLASIILITRKFLMQKKQTQLNVV